MTKITELPEADAPLAPDAYVEVVQDLGSGPLNYKYPASAFSGAGGGGGGSSVSASSASLTQDGAAALDTWEQWGTETVSFPGIAGTPVVVDVVLLGNIEAGGSGRQIGEARVQVSLDGGATWSSGNAPRVEVNSTVVYRAAVVSAAVVAGTPTGDVVVRAQLAQLALGAAGSLSFWNGVITARLYS